MLQPKKTKYRKQFKGRNRGVATRGAAVSFGEYGLKSTERARITARQIEAARLALAKSIISFTKSNAKAKSSEKSEAKELTEAFLAYDRNMLIADVRRKEAYKPGDSKARSKRQSSKR